MHLRCMRLGAAGRRHAFPLCPGLDLAYRQGDGPLVCVGGALRSGVLDIGWLIGLVNEVSFACQVMLVIPVGFASIVDACMTCCLA